MKSWYLFRAALISLALLVSRQGLSQSFPNFRITTNTADQSETAIAVNPLNINHLMAVWNDFKDAGQNPYKAKAGYAFSTDRGVTWPTVSVIPPYDYLGVNYTWGFDPCCAFDRSGNAYYCYVARRTDLADTLGPVHLSKTNNNGTDWSHARVSPGLTWQDKPFVAIDNTGGTYNGRIYIAWADFSNRETHIKFAVSVNGGAAFPTVINLANMAIAQNSSVFLEPTSAEDEDPPAGPFLQDAIPAVAPNGDVYVAWLDSEGASGSPGTIKVYRGIPSSTSPYISFPGQPKSFDITVTWGKRKGVPAGRHRISSYPTLAVGQNTGYIYVAWTQLAAGNNLDVYFSRSTNNGQSYSTPVIATDPAFNARDQFFPWLSVDPLGNVGLFFCDDRNDPNPTDAPLIDVYYTESADNGVSFATPNIRISAVTSDASKATFTTDYQGLASSTGLFFPTWNDFRNNQVDAYSSRFNSFSASNLSTATAWGSASKTVYTTSNSRWHRVFQNDGRIVYGYSTDDGSTWKGLQYLNGPIVVGTTSNPSLATRSGYLHTVFSAARNIYVNRNTSGSWLATPLVLTSTTRDISYLSFVIDQTNGTGHVIWVESAMSLGPPIYVLRHGTFTTTAPSPVLGSIADVYSADAEITNPALTLDFTNKPHAIWSAYGEIYYKNKIGSYWTGLANVSNTSGVSLYPSMVTIGSQLHAVWQDHDPGNYDIAYCVRSSSWGSTQWITSTSGASTYPFIGKPGSSSSPAVLWVENVSGNNEIYYKWIGQGTSQAFATTPGSSVYPMFASRSSGGNPRILALWTEGSSSPYVIEDGWRDLIPLLGKPLAEDDMRELPEKFALHPAYPNPFNPTTNIAYELPQASHVELIILNNLGREVTRLVDEEKQAGKHHAIWQTNGLASGIYFCRLRVGEFQQVRKLSLVR